jgi:hypothetical protein
VVLCSSHQCPVLLSLRLFRKGSTVASLDGVMDSGGAWCPIINCAEVCMTACVVTVQVKGRCLLVHLALHDFRHGVLHALVRHGVRFA